MKFLSVLIIIGTLFFALETGLASATAETVDILSPAAGGMSASDVTLVAESSADAVCEYKINGGNWSAMSVTGGTNHSQEISGLSSGDHNAHVHCCTNLNSNNGCGQAMNDVVSWNVNPAIPEFPSAAIPAALSIASFGMVSFGLRKYRF